MKRLKTFSTAIAISLGLTGVANAAPQIHMYSINGHVLTENVPPSFEDLTHFGTVITTGGVENRDYYIRNLGDANLVINSVNITGLGATDFAVTSIPEAVVAPNDLTFFRVRFDPTNFWSKTAKVTVSTNAPDNPLFEFNIGGSGAGSVAGKPNLKQGLITRVKEKIIEKKGITYLKGVYLVPIENLGAAAYTKKTSFLKVLSSVDTYLDKSDTPVLKIPLIKKSLEPGAGYTMKVKVKLEIPPGTSRIIFQIVSPDNYEEKYADNIRIESFQ